MGLGVYISNEVNKLKNWLITDAAIKDLEQKETKVEEKTDKEAEWERSYSLAVQNSISRPH